MVCSGFDRDIYDLYALGVLEDPESGEVRSHIRQDCDTCRAELQTSLRRMGQLAYLAPPATPPRSLRGRITGLVKPARPGWLGWWVPASGIAVLVLTVGGVVGGRFLSDYRAAQEKVTIVSQLTPPPVPQIQIPGGTTTTIRVPVPVPGPTTVLTDPRLASTQQELDTQRAAVARLENDVRTRDQQLTAARQELDSTASRDREQVVAYQRRIDELSRQMDVTRASLEQQRRELERNVQVAALLNAPGLRIVNLKATEQGAGSIGRALVADNGRVAFYASRLPALAPGRSYQLWFIRNRGTAIVSAGVFQPDASRAATLQVSDPRLLAGLTAMAVTEEPAGGSAAPTGHKILVGTAT